MKNFPKSLSDKLSQREQNASLRKLGEPNNLIDFTSNDYIGFAKDEILFQQTHELLLSRNIKTNGATGSRLLSGNHSLYIETEDFIANFHQAEAALIFNSGYDANSGFFSAVPQRNDIVLYDEYCHASIRDGISMGNAKAFKFKHNDLNDLENLLNKFSPTTHNPQPTNLFIVTESIFSMDGDSPDLVKLAALANQYNTYLVIDEAHSVGVYGENGEGLIQTLQLENSVFARIVTFGKALGSHGAAILGSATLKSYLVNFARSFIYSTALSPHSVASILVAYQHLSNAKQERVQLKQNAIYFQQQNNSSTFYQFSPIQSILFPGNENAKKAALFLQQNGFDVKPILSPTVPEGQERLRFCIHSYNSQEEIATVLDLLSTFVF
jgi:8-amino-7-oxononanoate synthase